MPAMIKSATFIGVDAVCVDVEVDVSGGLPSFATVGLAEAAVKEARSRVQAAITNSNLPYPAGRITVNLAPANVRKKGTGFDLPISLALLSESIPARQKRLENVMALAELSLTGDVRPVRGILAAALAARNAGLKALLVAEENGPEAALVEGLEVRTVNHLSDAVQWLDGAEASAPSALPTSDPLLRENGLCLSDVRGQQGARRALEIAAAGGHNLLFIGGPGCGKTMLAKRLPTILPRLTKDEALEVTRIHSVTGTLKEGRLIRERPFRAPHHTTTPAGLVGGGSPQRAGEMCLAHHGVLFLDELPEFSRVALEVMRQPLESGEVVLSRAQGTVTFPAQTQLVAAMNPCPCGYFGTERRCRCGTQAIARYRNRVSGPLLDRIDLHVAVEPIAFSKLVGEAQGETSGSVRARVQNARARQRQRGIDCNANLDGKSLDKYASLDDDARLLLGKACVRLQMSARSIQRVRKVARTIADIERCEKVERAHITEALQYRPLHGGAS